MAAKAIFVLCAQALLIQASCGQYINNAVDVTRFGSPYGHANRGWGCEGLAYDGLAAPFGFAGRGWDNDGLALGCGNTALEITPTSGGGLTVTSGSATPPVGVSLASENIYEGILAAAGELPFVGTVGVEGEVPTAGVGAVNYGCGSGVTVMESVSDIIAPGFAAPAIDAFGLDVIAPVAAIATPIAAPAAAIAGPTLGLRTSWAGPGCGYGF